MRYVTFDEAGKLTGAYLQDLHPDHADCHLEVNEAVYENWTAYRLVDDLLITVDPAPALDPVPDSITRRQGRLALLGVGKLDDVEGAIAAIQDAGLRRAAQIEYEADTWERGNAFLQQMWSALGGTEVELDELFRSASAL